MVQILLSESAFDFWLRLMTLIPRGVKEAGLARNRTENGLSKHETNISPFLVGLGRLQAGSEIWNC